MLVGTTTTNNEVAAESEGFYQHIDVHSDLGVPTTSLLRFLANSVTPGPGGADGTSVPPSSSHVSVSLPVSLCSTISFHFGQWMSVLPSLCSPIPFIT